MQYIVTLNGHEFPLTPGEPTGPGRVHMQTPSGELQVEVVSHLGHGRPALVLVDGAVYRVRVAAGGPRKAPARGPAAVQRALINGQPLGMTVETELERRARPNRNKATASVSQVLAPMPGRVVKVNVRPGDVVSAGATLLGIEAMKMENELRAPSAGRITKVAVQVGATVEADQELVVIEPE
jgi:biotin carboxyl carrier protein